MENNNFNPARSRLGETFIEDQASRFVSEKDSLSYRNQIDGNVLNVSNLKVIALESVGGTITDFTKGQEGQSISIVGDGSTTVVNGDKIITNTGADKVLNNNLIYRFTLLKRAGDLIWCEDAA